MVGATLVLLLAACTDGDSRTDARAADDHVPDAPVAEFTDHRNDCPGCPQELQVERLGVVAADHAVEARIVFSGGGRGDRLWLWFEEAAAHPMLLEQAAQGWRVTVPDAAPVEADDIELGADDDGLVVGLRGISADHGIAVVSGSGDRIPAVGYARASSAGADRADTGAVATQIAESIAVVQSGFPDLDDAQQVLARLTLARQLTPGTFRYDLAFADRPDLRLVAEVSVRFPELAQHIYLVRGDDLELAQSLFVLADGTTLCTWMTDGSADCGPATVALPVTGLVRMVADPASVRVEPAPARSLLDQVAPCWIVVTSADDGPPQGESCALEDGALAVNDNLRSGHRLVLTGRRDAVDDAAFVIP